PVLDLGPEGIDRPEFTIIRNYIGVIEQHNRPFAAISLQSGPERSASGKRFEDLMLDPFAFTKIGEEFGRSCFVAGRVGRIDLQILNQELDCLLPDLIPIEPGLVRKNRDGKKEHQQAAERDLASKRHSESPDDLDELRVGT